MTTEDKQAMITAAMQIMPALVMSTHAERVNLFRTLANDCAWNPEVWAVGAAVIVQMVPPEANRTSMLAAALEAAFDLGVINGSKIKPE